MGNLYDKYEKPERMGNNPYTRSGMPPPKMVKKSGSDAPSHRVHDPMRLELHMGDVRARTAGMSQAERMWRITWLKDQNLHPDEPVHVDAVYRQLNPVRILYRWPWDKLYEHFLRPTFGVHYGAQIRMVIPKTFLGVMFMSIVYYTWKYESKDWQRPKGIGTYPDKLQITKKEEIEERYPGATAIGALNPPGSRFFDPNFYKRYTILEVGESKRPW